MYLDPYLAHRGWSRDGFMAELAGRLDIGPDDALYLTGSFIDGMANVLSDIDVYLITRRSLDDRFTFANAIVLDFAGTTVDVEVFHPDDLRSLIDRVPVHPAGKSHDLRTSVTISPRQLKVLHNLCRSEVIESGSDTVEFVPSALRLSVARILFDHALLEMTALDADILGALTEGDAQSAGPMLFHYSGLLTGCLLAMNGETNPTEKWWPRLLDRLRHRAPSYGLPEHTHRGVRALLDAGYPIIEARLTDQYRLFRRLIHAANTIVPLGQAYLSTDAELAPTAVSEPTADPSDTGTGSRLPELHVRTRLRYDPGPGFVIVNAQADQIHYFDRPGFDLLTQFDGRTGADEAALRLAAPLGRRYDQVAAGFLQLRSFLTHYGYV